MCIVLYTYLSVHANYYNNNIIMLQTFLHKIYTSSHQCRRWQLFTSSAANDEEDDTSDSPEDTGGDRSVLVGVIVPTVLLILFLGATVITFITATVVWYVGSRLIITE